MDDTAYIEVESITVEPDGNRKSALVTIYITGLDPDYPMQRIVYITDNNVFEDTVEFIVDAYSSETRTATFGPYLFTYNVPYVTIDFTAEVAYRDPLTDIWYSYSLSRQVQTIPYEPIDPDEPLDPFDWDTPKIAGERFNVNATEWNRLTEFINAGLAQMGYSPYPFTYALPGEEFSAAIVNEVTNQLYPYEEIFDHIWYSGQDILASEVNAWRDQANYKFIPS